MLSMFPFSKLPQFGDGDSHHYRRARELVRQSRFHEMIALTFASIWMPTFMNRLLIPFIYEQVGGCEAVPFRLIRVLSFRARIPQYLRYVLMTAVRANPLIIGPIRRAAAVLVRTEDTGRLVHSAFSSKARVILERAVYEESLSRSPVHRLQLDRHARQRIEHHFRWNHKGYFVDIPKR